MRREALSLVELLVSTAAHPRKDSLANKSGWSHEFQVGVAMGQRGTEVAKADR